MDPDPDSTTDISVLDEMDQYLDECLDMEDLCDDVKEGPTPPKMNKNGSLSTMYNSTKYV